MGFPGTFDTCLLYFRGSERKRKCYCLLVHSLNVHNNPDSWDQSQTGNIMQVSLIYYRNPIIWIITPTPRSCTGQKLVSLARAAAQTPGLCCGCACTHCWVECLPAVRLELWKCRCQLLGTSSMCGREMVNSDICLKSLGPNMLGDSSLLCV